MKFMQVFIVLITFLHGSSDIYSQSYTVSELEHLYDKFDYFSNTESMECNRLINPDICHFDIKSDAHLGTIITILFVAMFLMIGFIGRNPDYDIANNIDTSEKTKDMINSRPIYWVQAIIVFILSLYMIKYIRSDDTNKIFNFNNKTLIIQNRDKDVLENYSFTKIKGIEILKYVDGEYFHYELNIRLGYKRLNIYAGRDDLLCCLTAASLSEKIKIPIFKIKTIY